MNFCYNGCRRVWHKTRRGKRHRLRGLLRLPLWNWARQYVESVSEIATHNSVETVTALLYSQRCARRPDYLRREMREMHTSHSRQGQVSDFCPKYLNESGQLQSVRAWCHIDISTYICTRHMHNGTRTTEYKYKCTHPRVESLNRGA